MKLNLCFNKDKFPKVEVKIRNFPFRSGLSKQVGATILVRGKEKKIVVELMVVKDAIQVIITGKSVVKLTDLEIPDPSIWIATVRDIVDITFKLAIPL